MTIPEAELLASETIVDSGEEPLYTYEQTAQILAISIKLVERFVALNLVEPQGAKLCDRDLTRIAKMLRLRRDLGLNWVGASMVLDMCQEMDQLKARLRAYGAHLD